MADFPGHVAPVRPSRHLGGGGVVHLQVQGAGGIAVIDVATENRVGDCHVQAVAGSHALTERALRDRARHGRIVVMHEPSRHGLAEIGYSPRAYDLVRFWEEPADRVLAEFVINADGEGRRASVRKRLTEDDNYVLLLFARRSTTEAIRRNSLQHAIEAVSALTLVDESKIDFRDLHVDFPLFAVRELGGDLEAVIDKAVESSEPGTASCFVARRDAAHQVTLRDCALVRVHTSHGVGFMDDWTDAAQPPVELAEKAVQLADEIEAEGSYSNAQMHVSNLPSVWFGGEPALDEPVLGCVSIHLQHIDSKGRFPPGLLVFLAEVDGEETALELCARSDKRSTLERPQVAFAMGSLLFVVIGGSTTHSEAPPESVQSLLRFSSIGEHVLLP